jgi:hypothetical protein
MQLSQASFDAEQEFRFTTRLSLCITAVTLILALMWSDQTASFAFQTVMYRAISAVLLFASVGTIVLTWIYEFSRDVPARALWHKGPQRTTTVLMAAVACLLSFILAG